MLKITFAAALEKCLRFMQRRRLCFHRRRRSTENRRRFIQNQRQGWQMKTWAIFASLVQIFPFLLRNLSVLLAATTQGRSKIEFLDNAACHSCQIYFLNLASWQLTHDSLHCMHYIVLPASTYLLVASAGSTNYSILVLNASRFIARAC